MASRGIDGLKAALGDRYQIDRELGQGGMATVYLAKDLKHERQVAIKVLKPAVAAAIGADRFLAEIKTTANLQHPHILPLHDSGDADGQLFYVMPFVEGQTLADRLDAEKQLPIDEAVRLTTEVADALQAAHDAGVIHRDIKPANILLSGGKGLVSDFGIALAIGPTVGERLTETGVGLGTPHYMSPEQATGEAEVGPRTDVYSLACVLYEMLAGTPPFVGRSSSAILGQILTGDPPPVTEHRKTVPRNMADALSKALEKVPADRFQTAREFAAALADPAYRLQGRVIEAHPGMWRPMAIGLGAAAVGLLAWIALSPSNPPGASVRSYQIDIGRNPTELGYGFATLAPNGSLIYTAGPDGDATLPTDEGASLWLKPTGSTDGTPIPGTQNGYLPTVSSDGERLAYVSFADTTYKTVPIQGGSPVTVFDSLPLLYSDR
ncbi:MAG: serine/threonine protein kinase, partial [Gemmatimonadota bacterium]|nr:serine/threonine protein kinase [Gemmatimonadota bacterium]